MFLSELITTIPNLMCELKLFYKLPNLKINFLKSHTLNITLEAALVAQYTTNFAFTWQARSITYLGIQLPANLNDLYILNYAPLLTTITPDLTLCIKSNLSWFGRAATIKINILPRILYIMQTVPISPPSFFFSAIRRLYTSFIWKNGPSRISLDTLSEPKHKGAAKNTTGPVTCFT